jgi:hypothetical protein
MKRTVLTLAAAFGLALAVAAPVAADAGEAIDIMVMKHACEASIQSEADFEAVEARGEGNPVFALANTVLACPTIANPGDEQSAGAVAGEPAEFTFTVTDSAGTTVSSADAEFAPAKLCEADIQLDANGDGTIAADVCLDISHYMFTGLVSGELTVEETSPPSGYRYGTVRFTPTELGENNDIESLVSDVTEEPIQLDTTGDTDNSVMLHVYNFETAMPGTDTVGVDNGSSTQSPWLPIALLLSLAGGTMAFATRRAGR